MPSPVVIASADTGLAAKVVMRRSSACFACLMFLLLLVASLRAGAQDAPVISGGVGFFSTTNGGQTFLQPVISPVALVPLGSKFLIESRADIRGFVARTNGNGPYDGEFFASLEYLQLDYLANSKLTLTVGRFLTPFGIYNERLTPIWIRRVTDAPLIFPIGTRTTGSSDGVMARGVLISRPAWQFNYAAYFSAASNAEQFQSGRAAGGRAGVFIPSKRLEAGVSYQRFLQDQNFNSFGTYLSWQPQRVPLDVKAEYAHSPSGQGYWIEGAFRMVKPGAELSPLGRLQPVVRMQQFFRGAFRSGDFLPTADTKRADAGFNYYLPHELRLGATYGRQSSVVGDRNVWNIAVTYRFLMPLSGGRK
jgi:hypothetical protein